MNRFVVAALILFASVSLTAEAISIKSLEWLTGSWAGTNEMLELEEIWNEPKAGSVQALVRLMVGGQMAMVEMVVIEEHEESLRLRIQQWGPGMEPGPTGRQSMKFVGMEEREVSFEAEDEGPIRKLTYRKISDDTLQIEVDLIEGGVQTFELKSMRENI